jgi:hypothetical protein
MRNPFRQLRGGKQEFWFCKCGGKWKTFNSLQNHVDNRERALDFRHGFSQFMKYGTRYNDLQKALERADG